MSTRVCACNEHQDMCVATSVAGTISMQFSNRLAHFLRSHDSFACVCVIYNPVHISHLIYLSHPIRAPRSIVSLRLFDRERYHACFFHKDAARETNDADISESYTMI